MSPCRYPGDIAGGAYCVAVTVDAATTAIGLIAAVLGCAGAVCPLVFKKT